LVNNAALKDDPSKGMFTFSDADFDDIIGTNLRGFLYLTRQAMRLMSHTGGGRIVNISSVAVHTANPNELLYACSKGGMEAATRTFALHGAKNGICVNAVAPAIIASGMGLDRALKPETLSKLPLGRAGKQEEVAALVLFLASEVSAYTTGTVVTIDGGRLLAR
jgi:3-oxoacyl-[acyl-carrier protein] reductase